MRPERIVALAALLLAGLAFAIVVLRPYYAPDDFYGAIAIGFRGAALGTAWAMVLTRPGMLFGFVPRFIEGYLRHRFPSDINRQRRWAFYLKPLTGDCELCAAGQAAFWLYLFCRHDAFNPLDWLLAVAFAILLAFAFSQWINQLNR